MRGGKHRVGPRNECFRLGNDPVQNGNDCVHRLEVRVRTGERPLAQEVILFLSQTIVSVTEAIVSMSERILDVTDTIVGVTESFVSGPSTIPCEMVKIASLTEWIPGATEMIWSKPSGIADEADLQLLGPSACKFSPHACDY
ncbi:MAG TPA: hypothetical protein VE422_10425 [Terriglobia bacterium]|nr:hypothetical protein [Terriglobia bacterium]